MNICIEKKCSSLASVFSKLELLGWSCLFQPYLSPLVLLIPEVSSFLKLVENHHKPFEVGN